ncbi:MAG: hypothetical protein ACXVI3_03560 [Halobacteriota archaeon]
MNRQSLRRIIFAYLIFLALCIPLALSIGGPIGAFCAGAVLLFFPGYFTSLAILTEQSAAGRIGTAVGFSIALLAVLEVAYTSFVVPGNFVTIVGPIVLWTSLMVAIAVGLKRTDIPLNMGALFEPKNLVVAAVLLFGAFTRLSYPLFVGTIPYFDPLYWATRAAYFVHTGFTGIPSILAGGSGDWIRERSFEFILGSFSMLGNVSVVDTTIWLGPLVGILGSIMLLAVLERLDISLSGKVVALFLFVSMSPLFEVFWRTDITIMQVVGTYFLFFGLYLCMSREVGSFLSGIFILGLSMDVHILYGIYTPFIFIFVLLVQLFKRQSFLTTVASVPVYVCGLMLFAWRFLERGVPGGFTPGLISHNVVPLAMQTTIPLLALQLAYPDPEYMLFYVTPLIAALAIVGLAGMAIDSREWELSPLILFAFVFGIFAGWIASTAYFSFDPASAEIFRGRGVAYAQAILIPAAGLGITTIERSLSRRSALISPGRVVAYVMIVLIVVTNATGIMSIGRFQSVTGQNDFDAIRYVGDQGNSVKLMFVAHPNPQDPYENASVSQRTALLYSENPSIYDSSSAPHREQISNSTDVLMSAIQSERGSYNYLILGQNLGYNDRNTLDNFVRSNGYVLVTKFGDAYVYRATFAVK